MCKNCIFSWINYDIYDGSGFMSCKKVEGIDFPHINELSVTKARQQMNEIKVCKYFQQKEVNNE